MTSKLTADGLQPFKGIDSAGATADSTQMASALIWNNSSFTDLRDITQSISDRTVRLYQIFESAGFHLYRRIVASLRDRGNVSQNYAIVRHSLVGR